MALINYKKFKITISGDSPKENGLQYGDVVIRKYFDKNVSYYSVLYVLNTGETAVIINGEEKQEKWFIGALIYGDEPGTGQPLDFARITSLSNKDRMGAMYMTAVDSDAPYLDIIDRIGFSGSINYPSSIGFYNQYDKLSYSFTGSEYFSASYNEFIGSEQRIIRLTRNSVPIPVGTKLNFGMQTLKGNYADQKIIVSYKHRSSSILSFDSKVSDENDNYILMSSSLNSETEWKNEFVVFSVSNIHDNSYFKIDISPLSSEGSWIEISDFNIIPLNKLTSWVDQTKVRIGRLSGVSDDVFGAMQDYGAYIQRLYASKDVNIAGTLTAGDKNGFGSTFYAGKIYKNAVQNSIGHNWDLDADISLLQVNPVGIGNVFRLSDKSASGNNHRFNYNTPIWYQENIGKKYVFSAWFKSGNGYKEFTLDDNDNESMAFYVEEEWKRIQFQFTIGSDVSNEYCFIGISGADTNSDFYICGMQVEEGENATAYQPTDGTITPEDNAYGVWMSRGGIGGTIQNPLLKLTNDGWIKSRGDRFYISPEGNAYFEGQIEAGSGKIGGWNISHNSIFSGVEKNLLGSYTDESGSITIGSLGVRSYRWRLENDGSGAFANGKINWDSDGDAFIGQWTIDSDSIYVGIKKSDPGFTSSGITIHSSGAIRSMYSRIESDGKLYATNADISGKITASLGEIGAWKIDSDSIYSGTKSLNASSFSVSDGSITMWSSGAISSRYFRLGIDGKVYANNVEISGKITASSGKIGSWIIDSNSIYSGTKGASSSAFTSSPGSITLWSEGAITSGYFRISTDGIIIASNVDVSGKITASSGAIGGWVVDSSSIYSGVKSLDNSSFTLSDGSITIWGSGAISSRYFRLGVDGKIYASNVDISGKIVASSGSVGSWNIDFDSIYSGTKALDNGSNTVSDGSITIWSSGSISARYFKLLSDGKIYASNADISGKISASSGVIGGWTINELSISGGNTIINSIGSITNGTSWTLNSDGSSSFAGGKISFTSSGDGYIGGWKINTNSIYSGTKALNDSSYTTVANSMTIWSSGAISAFNFRVGTDGKLYATNADISGKITASSGSMGLWNIGDSLFTGTENNISGQFTSAIGSITIGSNGIRGYKWRFESDGSGSIAGGNIYWDAAGLLTISGNASTASQLKVAVELWGNSFNGAEPIYGPLLIKNTVDQSKSVTLSVDIDGNLKIDGNIYATGEVSAYGAGSGTGTGSGPGIIQSVLGSTGLGGSYSDTDLTSTFNAYTINLINTNLTSALGRIVALETSTPNVAWGVATGQYSPLAINSVTRNLSLDGHTHSYLPLSGGELTRYLSINTPNSGGSSYIAFKRNNVDVGYIGDGGSGPNTAIAVHNYISGKSLLLHNDGILRYGGNTVWHAGNDGAGSGLDADMLDGFQLNSIIPIQTGRNFVNGTLITTSIDYSKAEGSAFYLEIKGNVYVRNYSCYTQAQGYIYSNSIINYGVTHLGYTSIEGLIAINVGGYLCFWFPRQEYWEGYSIIVLDTLFDSTTINRVTSVTDVAKPSGTKEVNLSSNTKRSAFTNSNVASATKLQTSRTIWGQSFNGEADVNGTVFTNIGVKSRNICIETDNLGNAGSLSSEINNFNSHLFLQQSTANNTIICGGGGNVGIGTNSPSYKLDVNGTSRIGNSTSNGLTIWNGTKGVTLTVDVDGNLKIDGNIYATGEVSAYGAGSGTGGGGGLISSVFGSAGLGGSYLDSDLTNTFNAYTINLINNNLTSALGRIVALETSTPNVAWGVATGQYSPLTINSVTRNLSLDGHTHSYFEQLDLKYIQGGDANHRLELGFAGRDYVNWYEYGGLWKFIKRQGETETELFQINPNNLLYKNNTIWHAGNDGAGSGLDADTLDGAHQTSFLRCDSIGADVPKNANYAIGTDSTHNFIQSHGGKPLHLNELGNYVYINNVLAATINSNVASATKLANTRTIWGQPFNGENDITGNLKIGYANAFGISYSPYDTNLYNYFYGGSVFNLKVGEWTNSNVNVFNIETHNSGTAKRALSVMNNGFVGINTTGPAYELDVNGSFRATDRGYINGDLYVGSASVDRTILTRTISSHDSGLLSLNPRGGNVVIGAPNAVEKLYVNGSTKVNGYFRVDNNSISAGEYEDNGYGFINVCRTASIENASYFSMVRAGTAAFGIGLSTDNSIIIGGATTNKTINNIHLKLNGNFVITDKPFTSTNRIYTGYDSGINNSISCSNWFRSSGESGWYSDTYGGGIYMTDSTYVKVYGSKSFWVNGNVVATGEVTAYSASDVRLKTEVTTLRDSLRIIELLNPVSYKWNSIAKELNPMKNDDKDYGLIAQELETVMPELVHTIYGGRYKSIDYMKLIPHLICAIKQLKMEVDHLKKTYY